MVDGASGLWPVRRLPEAVAAALAAVLGLWHLNRPALWADELATWGATRLSWGALADLLGTVDAAVGPYYAIMHLWVSLAGDSTAALRLPSVVAVVGATAVVTAIGRRVGGAGTGLLAGVLFALLPATSRYAQEARPYGMVMFGAALSGLLLLRLADMPSVQRAAAYAGSIALTGLLHPVGGLLLVAAHAVAVALPLRGAAPGLTARFAAAATAGALPIAALASVAASQSGQVSWIAVITWRSLLAAPETVTGSAAVGGIVLALGVLGWRAGPGAVLGCSAVIPAVLLGVVGLWYPIWVARYLVVVLPACAALAAAGLAGHRPARLAAVTALVAAVAAPAHLGIRADDGHRQASHRAGTVIGAHARPGDVLVYPDTHPSIPWAVRDIVERYVPAHVRPPDVLRTAPQRTGGRLLATECPDAGCLGTPPRIWVVRADHAADPLRDMPPGKRAAIEGRYEQRQRWQYPLLGIVLLERRGP